MFKSFSNRPRTTKLRVQARRFPLDAAVCRHFVCETIGAGSDAEPSTHPVDPPMRDFPRVCVAKCRGNATPLIPLDPVIAGGYKAFCRMPQVAKSLLGGCRKRGVRQLVSLLMKPGMSGGFAYSSMIVSFNFRFAFHISRMNFIHDYRYS